MYNYPFQNSAPLIEAINEMGAPAFVRSIMDQPDDFNIFNSMTEVEASSIQAALESAISPLIGDDLSLESIYKAIQKLRYHPDANNTSLVRAYSWMALTITEIDFNADLVASQFKSAHVKWRENRERLRVYHTTCPEYLAARLVQDICRERYLMKTRRLVELSIGRIALKEFRKDRGWRDSVEPGDLQHVVDWLKSSIRDEAPWLANVDEQGRPRKIMKAGSLEALCREADKQMRRKLNVHPGDKLGSDDVETFSDDGGEFHLVQLKTSAALKSESIAMRHCVGHGAYDEHLETDDYHLLSLRDKSGRPHMTIELRAGVILQSRGKANSKPKPTYAFAAARLLALRDLPYPRREAFIPEYTAPRNFLFGRPDLHQ